MPIKNKTRNRVAPIKPIYVPNVSTSIQQQQHQHDEQKYNKVKKRVLEWLSCLDSN